MEEEGSSLHETEESTRSSVSKGAKTTKDHSKRRRLESNASNDSSGSDYSAMTTPPSSVAVPEAVENYRTKLRYNEIERDNSMKLIEETKMIVSEVQWIRIDRCKESNILRKSVAHFPGIIDWIVGTRPPAEAIGNVTVLDGNARLSGMKKANCVSVAQTSCNAYNEDLNFTILEIFHAASAINSVEAEEVLHAFMRDKNTDSFAMACRQISSSVASYLRSLACGYNLEESRFVEESVQSIPTALNYLRSSLRAQRWKKKKSPESLVQSIEELWSKESIKARDKRGISIEISESIGDLAHDIYILPMKVVTDRNDKRRNKGAILTIQDAESVTNGVILFVDGEEGEAMTYCGEEILLITREVHPKGCLKRNFVSCRVVVRRNSKTLNKKETVNFLDKKGFKTINTYETFAAAFDSFTVFLGTCSVSALEFIGTYYRLLKRITVHDEEDKGTVEDELKTINWTIK